MRATIDFNNNEIDDTIFTLAKQYRPFKIFSLPTFELEIYIVQQNYCRQPYTIPCRTNLGIICYKLNQDSTCTWNKNKKQSEFFKAMTNTLFGSAARMCSRTHYYFWLFVDHASNHLKIAEKKNKKASVFISRFRCKGYRLVYRRHQKNKIYEKNNKD